MIVPALKQAVWMPDLHKRVPLACSPVFRMVQYRNRAEELRAIADALVPDSLREVFLRMAGLYDDLADRISGGRIFH